MATMDASVHFLPVLVGNIETGHCQQCRVAGAESLIITSWFSAYGGMVSGGRGRKERRDANRARR